MRHSPQRISPTRSTGPRSSQSRSYSRTAWRPPPRSPRVHPSCRAAGDEPVEDRLDLIGGRMPGRTQALLPYRVPLVPERSLAQPAPVELDHVRSELLAAEGRIVIRVGPPEPVIHVQR